MSVLPLTAPRWLRRPRARALAACAIVLAASALLMIPAFDVPGSELDEGLLVAYPSRVLHGELPHRDFYDPYGPASVWTVAAAYEVFGAGLGTERAVGMGYRLTIIGATFVLGLCWGLGAALLAALIVAALMVGSVGAPASVGFLALAMLGYALLARALLSPADHPGRLLTLAGALLAASLLMRYDFAPAVVLAVLPPVLAASSGERRRLAAGVAIGLAPLAAHLVLVGPDAFVRSARIAAGTHGRPVWPPFNTDLAELLALYALATGLLLATGIWLERRSAGDQEARLLIGGGLFGVGLSPSALTHVDDPHVVVASLPALALLPAVATVLVRGDPLRRPAPPHARAFALASVAIIAFFAGAEAIRFPVYHEAGYLLTGKRDRTFAISSGARTYRLGDAQAAHDLQVMIDGLERLARPGDSLFVGPRDLRTAGSNDVFLYFLMDKLEPASYFMQVDAHTINRPQNDFLPELSRADFLVLTNPLPIPDPGDLGPATPNEIVARRFCTRAASGSYRLYQRCR